jgi:hypothetical protein
MKTRDIVFLALLFFLLRKSGPGIVVTVPKPPAPVHPNPPPWWPGLPEPEGWPIGAPWPPFDENGNWMLPKDFQGRKVKLV